ncbi:MAG: ECF-type sigma factor [Gemmatimonadales bacterium]
MSANPSDRHASSELAPERLDAMYSLAYEELRRVAARVSRDSADLTLNPTALVHEAWLKLAASPSLRAESPLHLKRVAARAMRQVLVDAARRRATDKRGGGGPLITLDEALDGAAETAQDVLALDAAIEELARIAPRQAAAVESRFFGGFEVAETAAMLGVSEATVMRDWRTARAWLAKRLRGDSDERD